MRYDKVEEKEKLEQVNEELVKYMKEYPKKELSLTAIGHSISDGFSTSEPGKLLFDRNIGLIDYGNKEGLKVETFHLSRWENNNSLSVADWIRRNLTEQDTNAWNREDYKRAKFFGKTLLTDEQIAEIFKDGSDKKIQEVIFNSNKEKANIVILNLGTGSFLDIVTRHGSLTLPTLFYSVDRDMYGVSAILELIQNYNRRKESNIQVYLCGAPRIANTALADMFINPKMKRIGKEYANVTYVPSFPRQAFYKTQNGAILPDPHYNQAEYYHFLSEVEKKIIDNYLLKDLMIDLDRVVFQMSEDNDIYGGHYTKTDFKNIVDVIAKKYENKTGDYNYFIDMVQRYVKLRYPYDFFRLNPEENLSKEVETMKRKR